MRLVIDTRNGIAGDIVAAGLIGLGAPTRKVCEAMEAAGKCLGKVRVGHSSEDGIHRLNVEVPGNLGHLHASEARSILLTTVSGIGIEAPWSEYALRALDALVEAEAHVHARHPLLKQHYHGAEPVLHEASDIVIDLMGMAAGMMALRVESIAYVDHVNVGSGTVSFSHGVLEVPTPATRRIIDSHGMAWRNSETGMETATPTGVAILAGCRATRAAEPASVQKEALAGGTRPLPPIKFMLE